MLSLILFGGSGFFLLAGQKCQLFGEKAHQKKKLWGKTSLDFFGFFEARKEEFFLFAGLEEEENKVEELCV